MFKKRIKILLSFILKWFVNRRNKKYNNKLYYLYDKVYSEIIIEVQRKLVK